MIKLRKKVGNEALAERGNLLPTHRYCTVPHQLRAVEPIVTGRYLQAETQRQALAAAEGLPLEGAVAPQTVPADRPTDA